MATTPTARYVIIGDMPALDFDSEADADAIVTGLLFRRVFYKLEDAQRVAAAYPHRRPQIIPGAWQDMQPAANGFLESFLPLRKS